MSENADFVVYWKQELFYLAQSLEKEVSLWGVLDIGSGTSGDHERNRSNTLWEYAIRAGVVLFKLCGLGAFDEMPRIKTHILQIRAELRRCVDEFKVPTYYFVVKAPYGPPSAYDRYDAFFVKIFQGFCSLWVNSYEDRRTISEWSGQIERAKLYARILRQASEALRPKSPDARL